MEGWLKDREGTAAGEEACLEREAGGEGVEGVGLNSQNIRETETE